MAKSIPFKYGNKNSNTGPEIQKQKKEKSTGPEIQKAKEKERIPSERESKSYTEIPSSEERYENDFTKKAENLAKEEKKTKKKVSLKTGESSIMALTPMVTIKEKKRR